MVQRTTFRRGGKVIAEFVGSPPGGIQAVEAALAAGEAPRGFRVATDASTTAPAFEPITTAAEAAPLKIAEDKAKAEQERLRIETRKGEVVADEIPAVEKEVEKAVMVAAQAKPPKSKFQPLTRAERDTRGRPIGRVVERTSDPTFGEVSLIETPSGKLIRFSESRGIDVPGGSSVSLKFASLSPVFASEAEVNRILATVPIGGTFTDTRGSTFRRTAQDEVQFVSSPLPLSPEVTAQQQRERERLAIEAGAVAQTTEGEFLKIASPVTSDFDETAIPEEGPIASGGFVFEPSVKISETSFVPELGGTNVSPDFQRRAREKQASFTAAISGDQPPRFGVGAAETAQRETEKLFAPLAPVERVPLVGSLARVGRIGAGTAAGLVGFAVDVGAEVTRDPFVGIPKTAFQIAAAPIGIGAEVSGAAIEGDIPRLERAGIGLATVVGLGVAGARVGRVAGQRLGARIPVQVKTSRLAVRQTIEAQLPDLPPRPRFIDPITQKVTPARAAVTDIFAGTGFGRVKFTTRSLLGTREAQARFALRFQEAALPKGVRGRGVFQPDIKRVALFEGQFEPAVGEPLPLRGVAFGGELKTTTVLTTDAPPSLPFPEAFVSDVITATGKDVSVGGVAGGLLAETKVTGVPTQLFEIATLQIRPQQFAGRGILRIQDLTRARRPGVQPSVLEAPGRPTQIVDFPKGFPTVTVQRQVTRTVTPVIPGEFAKLVSEQAVGLRTAEQARVSQVFGDVGGTAGRGLGGLFRPQPPQLPQQPRPFPPQQQFQPLFEAQEQTLPQISRTGLLQTEQAPQRIFPRFQTEVSVIPGLRQITRTSPLQVEPQITRGRQAPLVTTDFLQAEAPVQRVSPLFQVEAPTARVARQAPLVTVPREVQIQQARFAPLPIQAPKTLAVPVEIPIARQVPLQQLVQREKLAVQPLRAVPLPTPVATAPLFGGAGFIPPLPLLPFGGGTVRTRGVGGLRARQPRGVTPGFTAVVFGIRGKQPRRIGKFLTGFEIRPLPGKPRKQPDQTLIDVLSPGVSFRPTRPRKRARIRRRKQRDFLGL